MSIGSPATSARARIEGAHGKGRLMVLGAGPSQAPGILKAAAAGYDVVTVDPYPGSVGHACAQAWVRCDTRDTDGVLDAAARLRIDGICTFRSDVAIGTVHQVRARLGLPGASPRAASVMAHKGAFREFQAAAGLPRPDFVQGDSPEALASAAARLRPPLWCKPVDSSGSRGVSRLADFGPAALMRAIEQARAHSRCGGVCVEEEAPGVEVGGDAILVGGRIAFIAVTQKYVDHGVVTGHRLPTHLSEAEEQRVHAAIRQATEGLGYREGPLNFDAMVSAGAVVLLEVSPRNGGNGLTDLIRQGCGVDVELATIRLALGESADVSPARRAGVGVRVLASETAGRIGRLPGLDEWQQRCGAIVDLCFTRREGDAVQPFAHSANAIGHVVFRCDGAADYERTAGEIAALTSTLFEAG